ncbi:hypothetical protein RUM44_013815 [Polyplax serrata]|uniref:Uncharacterized protein n=1 Tax=Polyplax serrata TaxID=468196 RepID=A0ABR1BIV7_POLSC
MNKQTRGQTKTPAPVKPFETFRDDTWLKMLNKAKMWRKYLKGTEVNMNKRGLFNMKDDSERKGEKANDSK